MKLSITIQTDNPTIVQRFIQTHKEQSETYKDTIFTEISNPYGQSYQDPNFSFLKDRKWKIEVTITTPIDGLLADKITKEGIESFYDDLFLLQRDFDPSYVSDDDDDEDNFDEYHLVDEDDICF